MYTENDYENNDFDEYNDEQQEVYEESFWDRNKGLIFKIIIIILCVLILIWLVFSLNSLQKYAKQIIFATIFEVNWIRGPRFAPPHPPSEGVGEGMIPYIRK